MRERSQGRNKGPGRVAWSTCLLLLCAAQAMAEPPEFRNAVEQRELLDYLADTDTFLLLDARSAGEFAAGHLAGALNVPHTQLAEHRQHLPADLDVPIVVYCRTGRRAGQLRGQLEDLGYRNVRALLPRQIFWGENFAAFNCAADTPSTPVPVPDPDLSEGASP